MAIQEQPFTPGNCRYCDKSERLCDCSGYETNSVESGEWIQPIEEGYRMVCCDCGLIHVMNFRIHEGHIQFQAFREARHEDL